jgi:hypothetical protein
MLRLSIALILPPSSFTFASITAYARRNQISQVVSSPHVTLDCYDLSPTLLFLLAFHSLSVPVSCHTTGSNHYSYSTHTLFLRQYTSDLPPLV